MPDVNRSLEATTNRLAGLWHAKPIDRPIDTYRLATTDVVEYMDLAGTFRGLTVTKGPLTTHIIYAPEEQNAPLYTKRLIEVFQPNNYAATRSQIDFKGDHGQQEVDKVSIEVFNGKDDLIRPLFANEYPFVEIYKNIAVRAGGLLRAPRDAIHYQSTYVLGQLDEVAFPDRIGKSSYRRMSDESGAEFLEWQTHEGDLTVFEQLVQSRYADKFKKWQEANKAKSGQRIPLVGESIKIRGAAFSLALNSEKFVANVIDNLHVHPLIGSLRQGR